MAPSLEADPEPTSTFQAPTEKEVLERMDPEFVKYYQEVLLKKRPTHQISIEKIRADPSIYTQPWHYDSSNEPRIKDYEVTSADGCAFPVRCYYPDPQVYGEGPYAVHINYHGGGFIFGNLTADSPFCLTLRDRVGLLVVDVNYRHCPEALFGKNVEDAWAALKWVRESAESLNVNKESISLGGISAGGYFSCILQHLARDGSIPLRLIIPAVAPTTDCCSYTKVTDSPFQSFKEFSNAPMLNWARISYFHQYVYPKDKEQYIRETYPDWWLAPLKAPNFKGLCDTFLITAECDPVRDEGEAYGMKLLQAGNKVTFRRYPGVPHPFMHMTSALTQARQYDEDIIKALKAAHGL